jgi:hypothetical protein
MKVPTMPSYYGSSDMIGDLPMVHLIQMCEGILGEPHIFHQQCGSRQGACHGGR